MANSNSTLLTNEERRSLYDPPVLNDAERTEYFTFTEGETEALYSFDRIDYAVYFAISLAFFKLKYTLINFTYRDVTLERQHVMQRYFSNKESPRGIPDDKDAISKIENKVLIITEFSRFREKATDKIFSIIQEQASFYPRQRQLCKALLNLMVKEKIAIPSFSGLQDCITQIWNNEQNRVIKLYRSYALTAS